MAENGDVRPRAARATTGNSDAPPGGKKRLRLPLKTMDDVKAELARLYREGKAGRREIADVSKLANVLGILGRLIVADEYEDRIAAIEEKLGSAAAADEV